MRLVVDASVALKWVLDEEGSDAATALIGLDDLLAPDLLFIECANTLAMKVRRKVLSAADARDGLRTIIATPIRLFPTAGLVEKAHGLAVEMQQTAYDSLYLALALFEKTPMITADRRFADAVMLREDYAGFVRKLEASSV